MRRARPRHPGADSGRGRGAQRRSRRVRAEPISPSSTPIAVRPRPGSNGAWPPCLAPRSSAARSTSTSRTQRIRPGSRRSRKYSHSISNATSRTRDFPAPATCSCPREIFDRVGGFRGEVAEDVDWGNRAVAAGYRFRYAPDVIVSHPARRTWPELTQKWRKASREAFAAAIERPNGRASWFLRSFAILASPFSHWLEVARSDKLRNARTAVMAIAVLFRIRFWRFVECNRLLLRG